MFIRYFSILTFLLFTQISFAQQVPAPLSYQAIDSIILLEFENYNYEKALAYAQEGRTRAKEEFGRTDSMYAQYTDNLAMANDYMGEFDKAESLYKEALATYQKVFPDGHINTAYCLSNLGYYYDYISEYKTALAYFVRSKELIDELYGNQHIEYIYALNNIGRAYIALGDYDLAIPVLKQAQNIHKNLIGEFGEDYSALLSNLALAYSETANHALAIPYLKKSAQLTKEAKGEQSVDYAYSLSNLGLAYQQVDEDQAALEAIEDAKHIYINTLGRMNLEYATIINNLALLHQKMDHFEQAEKYFLEAQGITKQHLSPQHSRQVTALNNLVGLYEEMGKAQQSWQLLRTAIQKASNSTISLQITEAWADSLLNTSYLTNRHLEEMITLLQRIYVLLGYDRKRGSRQQQIIVANLAMQLLQKYRSEFASDKDKLRILSTTKDWLLKGLRLIDRKEQAHKGFSWADQNKSALLLQATQAKKAFHLGNLPDSLYQEEQFLINEQKRLKAALIEERPATEKDSLRDQLSNTNQAIKNFSTTIRKEYPKYAEFHYSNKKIELKEVQQQLLEKTAMLEYVLGDSVVYVFYIDKQKIGLYASPINNKRLSNQIDKLHRNLSDYMLISQEKNKAYKQYTQSANWFYQNLLGPVLDSFVTNSIQELVIVTDGRLGHLPFESFLSTKAPQSPTDYNQLDYLINHYQITYNYSASLWMQNTQAKVLSNNGQLLAMAASYTSDTLASRHRLPHEQQIRRSLNPIPAAISEVEMLQEKFRGTFLQGRDATERSFKNIASDYAVIHLAMHGLLNQKDPILSSLVFTEDGDSIENNFLQAHEISKMNIKTNLVVLSACETGFGKFETGNGIASLARSFMYAGASSLLVSLWQVNDQATAKIMQFFYQYLRQGKSKSAALRQAKLDYIESSARMVAHPAFWSAFVLIGNDTPIQINRKQSILPWVLGSGILLLLLGGLWILRKKRAE